MRGGDRQLAALPVVRGASAAGVGRAAPPCVYGRHHRVRAGAVDVRARRAAHGEPTHCSSTSRRPTGRHRGSSWLQDVPAAGPWLVATGRAGLRARRAFDWAQRDDPAALADRAHSLGHFLAAAPVDHPVHDPGSVLPVPGGRIAGAGVQAGASRPHRRARRRLCRRGHAGLARLGEQHAGRRAVRRVRMLDRVCPRRRPAAVLGPRLPERSRSFHSSAMQPSLHWPCNLPWRALPRRRFSRWRWDVSSCLRRQDRAPHGRAQRD